MIFFILLFIPILIFTFVYMCIYIIRVYIYIYTSLADPASLYIIEACSKGQRDFRALECQGFRALSSLFNLGGAFRFRSLGFRVCSKEYLALAKIYVSFSCLESG